MNILAQAAALAALASSAPVAAETYSVPVSFADLNLASAAGKATLERRIENAVRTVCGTPDGLDLSSAMASRDCAVKARATAQPLVSVAVERAQNSVRIASVH